MTRPAVRLLAAGLAAALLATTATATPLPVPKPEPTAPVPAPVSFEDKAISAVRLAVSALDLNDLSGAMAAVAKSGALERDLVTWLAIRRQVSGLTPQAIEDFAKRNPHWPTTSLFRYRSEQALLRMDLSPKQLVQAFAGSPPVSDEGILGLARAEIALGRKAEAAKLLTPWWARETLSPDRDRRVVEEFGEVLDKAAHKARFEMLMYADRVEQARRLAPLVGKDYAALVEARSAVLRGMPDAGRKLDGVAGEARTDPLHAYTLAEWLRRSDRNEEAAKALMKVPAEAIAPAHADAWWVERRIISRGLAEEGKAALAYELAAAQRGGNPETVAEAHFHAGWYALRFLDDPAKARRHFADLQKSVTLPLSRSRAAYWLGRTEEAAGNVEAARAHYRVAAADEATFYGQLAHVKLGRDRLAMPPVPEPTAEDRLAFARNDLARATILLVEAGAPGEISPLVNELARQLPSGGQVALLAEWLSRRGDHRTALQVGKLAADRNLGTERLAFPIDAIPRDIGETSVEPAMIYAIARQESAFHTGAVSHAGAMGLLQLLPGTARETAQSLGLPFSAHRLTRDPDYNATLGAAHLGELVQRFGGSYILAFAAYNAGPRRALEWIERFGDPRDPAVDPVDWIERIPFGETRSYVQRVTENLQVYRERLDESARLAIADDLLRGPDRQEAVR